MKCHPLSLSVCCLVLAGCGLSEGTAAEAPRLEARSVQVVVATAETGAVTEELEFVGNFVARRRAVIVTEVDGAIASLAESHQPFDVPTEAGPRSETLSLGLGQRVEKGAVLAQIDARDYELALAASQTALDAARVELAVLEAWRRPEEVRRLRALRDQAALHRDLRALDLKRFEGLKEDNIVSESEYDQAQSAHSVAEAVLDGAEAALLVATNGPTKAEIALVQSRIAQAEAQVAVQQDRRDRTTIRAPFDGVVTERYVEVGERVTAMPRVEILELMDLSLVFVEVGVPERHLHQVGVHDAVTVRAEGVTDPVPGTVVRVNDKVDRASRTYRVRVVVDNADRRFKAGQFVRVVFAIRSATDQVVVPRRAVTYGGGQPQVFVHAGEHVALRNVRLGLSDGERTAIVEGLKADESVVVDDPAVLADGMRVVVRQPKTAAAEGAAR